MWQRLRHHGLHKRFIGTLRLLSPVRVPGLEGTKRPADVNVSKHVKEIPQKKGMFRSQIFQFLGHLMQN